MDMEGSPHTPIVLMDNPGLPCIRFYITMPLTGGQE